MAGIILDGRVIAEEIRGEVAIEVMKRIENGKPRPGLATVLVGENPASQVYVRMKHKACEEAGIQSFGYLLPDDATQEQVERLIQDLNADSRIHGILIQLPLPSGLDEEKILNTIDIRKDVDGVHPLNIGRLAKNGRDSLYMPCTPAGVMYLINDYVPSLEGKNAVVLGRSNIVGMPVALLLLKANATVTVCHSHSIDLAAVARQADVLVAAVGIPAIVRRDWIKPGAVVIDVGINRIEDLNSKKGYRLVGDVAFNEVIEVAGAITPVPGGVGPMAVAMLLKNTLRAVKLSDK